jgi:hypothetical protein
MKAVPLLALCLTIMSGQSLAFAQDRAQGGSTSTEKGATGWTGGSRPTGTETTGQSQRKADEERAADQPLTATGIDLKGPAKRLPQNKTPE